MKWQAIAGVTGQINEAAKYYHDLKLKKDAAAEIPLLWSDFITDTSKSLHESQNHIEVSTDTKTGGLGVRLKFDELHDDFATSGFAKNNKAFLQYALNKYDERTKDYLSRSKNPYTGKLLSDKIGSYRTGLADKINQLEISLIDSKRHSMLIDSAEKLSKATYDNPELYDEHISQLAVSLDALPLMPDKKDQFLKASKEKLAESAALGIIKQSPQEFLNSEDLKNDLPLNIRIKLERQAQTLLKSKQVMLQNQVKSLAHSHFAGILKGGKGIDGFGELAASAFDEDDTAYLDMMQKEKLYNKAHLISDQLKHAPLSGGMEILAEIAPKSGDRDYAEKEKIHHILVKQFNEHVKLAFTDAARFVEELFAEDIPQDLPFAQRLLFVKQLQEKKGIPSHLQRLLTNAQRDEYIRKLQGTDANEIKKQLDSIMAIGEESSDYQDSGYRDSSYQTGLELLSEVTSDLKHNIPIHFYAENHLYTGSNNRTRRDLANVFAQIIPVQKQLFSSSTSAEKRELEEEINNNTTFKEWREDTNFQQPYNIANSELMQQGIRQLAKFYQLSHGMKLDKAVKKATQQMIEDCYMQPLTGLQIPKEIITDGQIHQLESEYIASSLVNLQRLIIKGDIACDMQSSFGIDYMEEHSTEKIQSVLKDGRWFLSPDRKQIYYAYQMADGGYQSLMVNEQQKLMFNLIDLNEPETQQERQIRMNDELMEVINLEYSGR